MERLNFNHFYYFYVVAQLGSIKEAADRLHVSAPTISDQIRLLEDYFQCKLFERVNRSLKLTKEGEFALGYAERSFSLASEVTARLRNQLEVPKSSVDVGITHWMSQYFISETLLPLYRRKGMTVNIHEAPRHLLLADLDEGNIDIVFTDSKDSLSSNMQAFRMGKNRTFIVAREDFRKGKRSPFPKCLNGMPFLNYTSDSYLRHEIDLYFLRKGLNPLQIGEADDIDFHQMIVEDNIGFAVVPEVAKERFCRNPKVKVLGELDDLETTVYGVIQSSYKGILRKMLQGKL